MGDREPGSGDGDEVHGHLRASSGRPAAEVRLGLDGHNLADRGRVVGEVEPRACADLHHAPPQPCEELVAVLRHAG